MFRLMFNGGHVGHHYFYVDIFRCCLFCEQEAVDVLCRAHRFGKRGVVVVLCFSFGRFLILNHGLSTLSALIIGPTHVFIITCFFFCCSSF